MRRLTADLAALYGEEGLATPEWIRQLEGQGK
jgi:hypothetical protein